MPGKCWTQWLCLAAVAVVGCGVFEDDHVVPGEACHSSSSGYQASGCRCPDDSDGVSYCGRSGVWGACQCGAEACHESHFDISGTVQTSLATIDYTGGKLVRAYATHKIDVDTFEDGCFSKAKLQLKTATGACELTLEFDQAGAGASSTGRYGGLIGAYLTANSDCLGFPDAVEGTYATQGSGYAPFFVGSEKVTEHQTPADCVPLTITFPDVSIPLLREEPAHVWMSINLKGLTLRGALFSTGSESAQCLDTTCAPQRRDGGGGWCIGKDEPCAPGYHNDGRGQCVPDTP